MAFQPVNAAVSGIASQVYNPAAVGTPTASIYNSGNSIAYLGGSAVTFATGFALYPGQGIEMPSYSTGIWAIAAPGTLGTSSTLSANVASGTNASIIASTSGFGTSSTVQVGAGNAAETLTIATISGTNVTFTTNTRWAHASGEAVALMTAPQGTSLNVLAGTR